MWQKTMLLVFIFFRTLNAISQDERGYFALGLNVGPSFPLSNFSNKQVVIDPTIINANGIANTGFVFNMVPGYSLNKRIHFYLQAGLGVYKQDQQALEAHIKKTLGTNNRVEVDEKAWKIYKFLGGFSYSFFLARKSKFSIQPKIAVGFCGTSSPGYKVTWYDQNGNVDLVANLEDNKLPLTFCVETGLGLGYVINKQFDLHFSVDYFNSTPRKTYSYNPYFPSPGSNQSSLKRFNLSSAAIDVGFSYKIWTK